MTLIKISGNSQLKIHFLHPQNYERIIRSYTSKGLNNSRESFSISGSQVALLAVLQHQDVVRKFYDSECCCMLLLTKLGIVLGRLNNEVGKQRAFSTFVSPKNGQNIRRLQGQETGKLRHLQLGFYCFKWLLILIFLLYDDFWSFDQLRIGKG